MFSRRRVSVDRLMSGILCVSSPNGIQQADETYLAALRRLAHRGRDGHGRVLRPSLFPGMTRGRPCVSDDGTIIVGLDGHIHDREELAHSLAVKG